MKLMGLAEARYAIVLNEDPSHHFPHFQPLLSSVRMRAIKIRHKLYRVGRCGRSGATYYSVLARKIVLDNLLDMEGQFDDVLDYRLVHTRTVQVYSDMLSDI